MGITIQNISKSYGGRAIFTDFSLDVLDGMRLCVCGPNGCGKSTLLRIMAGASPADSGKISSPRGTRLGYVEQTLEGVDLETPLLEWVQAVLPDWGDFWKEWDEAHGKGDESTLLRLQERQHDLEARYGYNPEQRAQSVLSGLGFSKRKWGQTVGSLSGGWRERAKLARVLTQGADVLLLDEPTNHLDMDAVEWLEEWLLGYKGALVFVAHDRYFMDKMGTHILYLGAAKPVFRKATFTQFLEFQEELEEQREREAKKLAEEIDHKMDFVRRFQAKATKARQASSRKKMAKKLEKELEQYQPEPKRKELAFKWPEAARSEKVVMSVTGLDFAFPDGQSLWPPLSFQLFRGQKIALVGHNGCGKSTLLKLLMGKLQKTGGDISVSSLTRMGYYSQQQAETFDLNGTVLGETRRLSDPKTTEEELMSVLGLFMLGQGYFDRFVYTLSGGERSRMALALLFLARCNLLVLDEPTNHLDLESREALIEALDVFDGTLFMVAHDRHLLAEVADEIWAINEDGKNGITVYEDGYAEYDAARKERQKTGQKKEQKEPEAGKLENLSREALKQKKREQAEKRNSLSKEIKPLQDRYEKMEKELEAAMQRQSEVEAMLADPDVYNNGEQASVLLREFHTLKTSLEGLMEQMEPLEEKIQILEAQRAAVSGNLEE